MMPLGPISKMFQDASVFWAALGAIAQAIEAFVVLISAIVVIFQLRRMRQESIRDRIAGLTTAVEVLRSDVLQKVLQEIPSGANIRGVNWNEVLDQLDLIGLLIREGYTDENLFFRLKRHELRLLATYLSEHSLLKDADEHPDAKWMLERALK